MTIRAMRISDYDSIWALWMDSKNMGFNDLDDSREGIERFLERNPSTSFVAEENDRLLGVILAGHDGRRGYIYHMCVREGFRRRGIGAALVNASLEALKGEGINKVALLVFHRNKDGNAFWERQGFTLREDVGYRNKALANITRIDT